MLRLRQAVWARRLVADRLPIADNGAFLIRIWLCRRQGRFSWWRGGVASALFLVGMCCALSFNRTSYFEWMASNCIPRLVWTILAVVLSGVTVVRQSTRKEWARGYQKGQTLLIHETSMGADPMDELAFCRLDIFYSQLNSSPAYYTSILPSSGSASPLYGLLTFPVRANTSPRIVISYPLA